MTQPKPGTTVSRIHLKLFLTFFRIGLFTFGGGFAMLPLIEREITEQKKWIQPDELIDMIALAQSMPGPVAINASVFVGRRMAGVSGAVAAMLGCTLPSVIVILAVAIGTSRIQEHALVQQFFTGVLAAVTTLILLTVAKMARRVIKDWLTAVLAITSLVLVAVFGVHALLVIIGGALLGFLLYWLSPMLVRRITGHDRRSGNKQGHASNDESDDQPSESERGTRS